MQISGRRFADLETLRLTAWYEGGAAGGCNPGVSELSIGGGRYWNGAKDDAWSSHVAITVPDEDTSNEWLEPVADRYYDALDPLRGSEAAG